MIADLHPNYNRNKGQKKRKRRNTSRKVLSIRKWCE